MQVEQVLKRTLQDIFDDDTATLIEEQDRRVMETRAPDVVETNIDGVGDDFHDYLTIKFPVIDDENVSSLVPLAIDITEQKRTDFELRKSKETAELVNRAETEFLANISNELRTPLNLIIWFSDVLQTDAFGPISEKYREYASDINRSGGHLLA